MASNSTAPEIVAWKNNYGRGTWDVISSCLLTLVLCVWTALHLNVPKQNSTLWDCFKTKALWVIVGILAPEVVVYIAWVQYSSAKHLLRKIQELGADGTGVQDQELEVEGDVEASLPPPDKLKMHKWTMSHCYFASMGGFAIDTADNEGQEYIPGSPSLQLSSHAILFLAKLDKLPNISTAEISDKSKADGLAKTLVCLQASWLILQCVGRLASKLPITLLEINTVGHCLCALVIYLIWWNKPLHVLEPIFLRDDWMRKFTSFWWLEASLINESGSDSMLQRRAWCKSELSRLQMIVWNDPILDQVSSGPVEQVPYELKLSREPESYGQLEVGHTFTGRIISRKTSNDTDGTATNHNPSDIILAENEAIRGLNFIINPGQAYRLYHIYHTQDTPTETRFNEQYPERKFVIKLTACDLKRWALASDFINHVRHTQISSLINGLANTEQYVFVADSFSNVPYKTIQVLSQGFALAIGFMLTVASALYGSFHLSSWNSHFPTVAEKWLWISSAICIASTGFFPLTICAIVTAPSAPRLIYLYFSSRKAPASSDVSSDEDDLPEVLTPFLAVWDFSQKLDGILRAFRIYRVALSISKWVAILAVCLLVLAYCFSRAFIVVEAFISLRALPLDYYETPVWSNYIPHL